MFNLHNIKVLINVTNARKMYYTQEVVLSQKNREECVKKMKEIGQIKLRETEANVRSAVLIPLCIVNKEVSILYTLRSSNLKSFRGQVSFPGGKEEKDDKNLEETAIRETVEELGISKGIIDVWGSGRPIVGRLPVPSILPVVGFLKDYDKSILNVNAAEVEKVFTVSLRDLCYPANNGFTQFTGYSLPVFNGGEHRIWGITALMTHMFLMCLLPTEAYTFQLQYVTPLVSPTKASL